MKIKEEIKIQKIYQKITQGVKTYYLKKELREPNGKTVNLKKKKKKMKNGKTHQKSV